MDNEKKYKVALERARKMYNEDCGTFQSCLEQLFPELKESEDEKIRKDIISYIKAITNNENISPDSKKECKTWIAWLEKQGEKFQYWKPSEEQLEALDYAYNLCPDTERGNYYEGVLGTMIDDLYKLSEKQVEQKPADKVEPKFHEGEWLCENEPNNYARFIQILETVNVQGKERYRISRDIHNDEDIVEFDFVEKYYHKFDIQDAKDGDVLAYNDGSLTIFHYRLSGLDAGLYMSHILLTDKIEFKQTCAISNVRPAAKEQRDLLFQKMKEEGYAWDAEKKELEKVVDEEQIKKNLQDNSFRRMFEQKHAWSEEDEDMRYKATEVINRLRAEGKEYVWSINTLNKLFYWLKSLKDRVQPQPSQEWSEGDERMLKETLALIETAEDINKAKDGFLDVKMWLKSLRPQSQWKPSDEQLDALYDAAVYVDKSMFPHPKGILMKLYKQLKKLKG